MKFNFRKIGAALTSVALIGASAGVAAAANYPAPFVSGSTADVAIVYGSSANIVDSVEAGLILSDLQSRMTTSGSGGSTTSVTGEAAAVFSGGTKLYINDSLNIVKNVLTETDLPTVLKKGDFSGFADATYTQRIDLGGSPGANPRVTYAKQPTSDTDPAFGLTLSTTQANYIYNATVIFSKDVNFTHADSEGEKITLFGQEFTVSAETDSDKIVLLKSAVKASLSSDVNPSQEVSICAKKYTVELVGATDTSATIKVTDEAGGSASKEITEAKSAKVQGVTIAIDQADEGTATNRITADIIVGAEKVTLDDGNTVKIGESDTTVDGTDVKFNAGRLDTGHFTQLPVSVAAKSSDTDAVIPGGSFADPVYGSFKVDFSGISSNEDASSRETIAIFPSGDDKMQITFKDHRGLEKTFQWAMNQSGDFRGTVDADGHNITVLEAQRTYRNDYMVVGNEDEGFLLKVYQIDNSSSATATDDTVKFQDVFSGDLIPVSISAEGTGTMTVGGRVFTVNYYGASSISSDLRYVRVNYPDSSGQQAVIMPTIQTSKGAKVSFYPGPIDINLTNWDRDGVVSGGVSVTNTTLSGLLFPDGDGYETITIEANGVGAVTGSPNAAGANISITDGST